MFEAGSPGEELDVTPSSKRKPVPSGPTNTIAMSLGKVWLKLFKVTVTAPGVVGILPVNPETVISEGYGFPLPTEIGIDIGAEFVNATSGLSSSEAAVTFLPSDTAPIMASVANSRKENRTTRWPRAFALDVF
jgi:hypothetical protein